MATATSDTNNAVADCFACRAVGTGAFAGLGLFCIFTARSYGSNKAISAGPGAILGIRLAGYGEVISRTQGNRSSLRCPPAFLAAAAMRWTAPQRLQKRVPQVA